jgi:hypothetical protein
MNQDESVALWRRGQEAWNAWAEDMLAKRKQLEASSLWALEKDSDGEFKPKNAETRAWINAAKADFSGCLFLVQQRQAKAAS